MAKYNPLHTRLLFIDRKLREKCFPNCGSLADEWEVSVRTIQRDLDHMRYELDAPIEYSAQHRGYYYTEDQYQLPALNIRESDLFAIYLAEKLLTQYEGTPIYDNLRSMFGKIEASLPDKTVALPSHDPGLFTVLPPFTTVILPDVLTTVFDCLRNSTRMTIDYRSPGGEVAPREIDPYHGVRFEGDWYVVGHCHLRQAIRTFSLARMAAARKGTAQFVRPASFDFRKLFGSHFGIHWGKDEVEVRIHFSPKAAAYVRERQWHPSQRLEERNDGSLILVLTVNHLLELKRWILSWGDGARVIAPRELADDLCQTACRMAAMARMPNGDAK
ncbi:WYL domain-containing transcriptional regulator [Desulfobulbus sp.]|uniref:helix-turn-helix transcriptional regulator n=1 Tax=Desulfobulbus sp. TaxID=895 RepID=UPI00286EE9AF|nr:WYL domain-containing transcriptional regulator [Desulfobulbus sp.]